MPNRERAPENLVSSNLPSRDCLILASNNLMLFLFCSPLTPLSLIIKDSSFFTITVLAKSPEARWFDSKHELKSLSYALAREMGGNIWLLAWQGDGGRVVSACKGHPHLPRVPTSWVLPPVQRWHVNSKRPGEAGHVSGRSGWSVNMRDLPLLLASRRITETGLAFRVESMGLPWIWKGICLFGVEVYYTLW